MEDFVMRTITEADDIFSVSRMINSNGFESVVVKRDNSNVISLNYSREKNNKILESLISLLTKILNNECKLPEVKE